jgi:flavin-dependent dehydrogenase
VSRPGRSSYDAIVVGARIAGATVAALLGDQGLSVLLVERVRFPSTTISTHFFRGAGLVAVLDRLEILPEVLALGSPPLRREWSFGFGTAGPDEGPPQDPGDAGYCLSVRRAPLDDLLLARAQRSAGVELVQPVSVHSLLREDGRVVGARLRDRDGEFEVRSRIVIGADGRHSLVARDVGAAAEHEVEALRTLYYRYVSGWRDPDGNAPDAPEFSLSGDEMAYVFPSDGDVACVGVSAPRDAFPAFRQDPDAELDRRLAAHPGLAARLDATVRVGRAAGGPPEASWARTPTGPGWALVGDAAVHQDPWTGEGMDNAGRHAMLAAEALGAWLAGGTSEQEAGEIYHSARDEHVLERFGECTSLARDLRQLAEPPITPE